MDVTLPSVRPFQDPLRARHDIVHRSGQTEAGQPFSKTEQDIESLCGEVLRFANEVDQLITAKDQGGIYVAYGRFGRQRGCLGVLQSLGRHTGKTYVCSS